MMKFVPQNPAKKSGISQGFPAFFTPPQLARFSEKKLTKTC